MPKGPEGFDGKPPHIQEGIRRDNTEFLSRAGSKGGNRSADSRALQKYLIERDNSDEREALFQSEKARLEKVYPEMNEEGLTGQELAEWREQEAKDTADAIYVMKQKQKEMLKKKRR